MGNPSGGVTGKEDEHWDLVESFVRVGSRWVTLIGERWRCDKGKILEYWRVEKADSVIVLPLQGKHISARKTTSAGGGATNLGFSGWKVTHRDGTGRGRT